MDKSQVNPIIEDITEEEFDFFAEIDDLIGDTKVERLSRGRC